MTDYYIAPSPAGDDTTGNGSYATPWATLTKANVSSSNNDTIILKDGTYTWSGLGDMTSIRTYQGETVPKNVIIDGGGADLGISVGNALAQVTVKNIRFTNIDRSPSGGVYVIVIVGYPVFQGCVFDNFMFGTGFSSLMRENFTLINCLFYKMDRPGSLTIAMFSSSGYGSPIQNLTNCTVVFNGIGTYPVNQLFSIDTLGTTYNLTNINVADIIGVVGGVSFSNRAFGQGFYTANVANVNFYNISDTPTGTNVTTVDPEFIDAGNDNYNLQITSPLRGVGVAP